MSQTLAVVSIILCIANAPAETRNPVTLRWHGQSFFELQSSKGTRIVFDPHSIEGYGRITVAADLVLISHMHPDHSQIQVVENRDRARILNGLVNHGRKVDWNPISERFHDMTVRTVGSYHDDSKGAERGKNTIFIVDVDGLRFVHLGDLGHLLSDEQVRQIGRVDVLMIPVGGVYTINGEDAAKVVEQLKPQRYIIPMHYGNQISDDLMPIDEFLENMNPTPIKKLATNVLTIDPNAAPVSPTVIQLNWK